MNADLLQIKIDLLLGGRGVDGIGLMVPPVDGYGFPCRFTTLTKHYLFSLKTITELTVDWETKKFYNKGIEI